MPNFDVIEFLTLTNESITVLGSEGWRFISVIADDNNSSDGILSGPGTNVIGQKKPGSVVLKPGKSWSDEATGSFNDLTINAPDANCTLYIEARKYKHNI
jgi:hypothetical protein